MVLQEIFVRFRTNAKEFAAIMRMPMNSFKKLHTQTGQVNQRLSILNKRGMKTGLAFRKGVQGLRGFRMEMLSLMFGGMMLQKAMFGLLKPAMTAVGIFEIWGAMLTILFLPVAMFLLNNFFLPMMDWFINAPPWIKNTVGAFVLLLGILGSILMLIGQLTLFMGGLTMAFPATAGAITAFVAAGAPLIAMIAGMIAATVGLVWAITSLWKNWDGTWKGLADNKFATYIIAMILGPLGVNILFFMSLFKKFGDSWIATWEKVKSAMKPIGEFFRKWIIDPIVTSWEWMINKIIALWDSIKNIWEKVTGFVGKATGGVLGSRQSGGYIPHTGLYKLHQGETVNQAGNSFSPNITVNATSNVDIEMLKTQLSSAWNEDLNRMSRR